MDFELLFVVKKRLVLVKRRKMMRTRSVWFALGLCSSAAAISQFFGRDLLRDRRVLFNDTIKFNALEQRLDKLESLSSPSKVDDKLPL